MIEKMKKSIARIHRTSNNEVVGAGFLVDLENKIVITCAHVVNAALGTPDNIELPVETVMLDFPFTSKNNILHARTIAFAAKTEENEGDLAVLQLIDPLPETGTVVPLLASQTYSGDRFGVFGFPPDFERDGQYAEGKLQERLVNNRIQAIGETDFGYFVVQGFSGSPVFDLARQAVIGMMTQVDGEPEKRVAFITPIDLIPDVYGNLSFQDLRTRTIATNARQDYKYDLFISYRNTPHPQSPLALWIKELLYEELKDRLFFELGRIPEVSLDTHEAKTDEAWRERLKQGLAYSRCLIAVWNKPYFYSRWCISECKVMLYREKQLGYRTFDIPEGLVLPISTHKRMDDLAIPDFAQSIQYRTFADYFFPPNKAFRESQKFQQFQEKLREWIEDEVAPAIENAPKWTPQMLSFDWLDRQIFEGPDELKPIWTPPSLA